MKFTQKQLLQIIKEEIAAVLSEASDRDIDDAIKDLLGSTESAGIKEIVEDLPMYGNDSDKQGIEEELEELIEKGEVVKFEDDRDGEIMYKLA